MSISILEAPTHTAQVILFTTLSSQMGKSGHRGSLPWYYTGVRGSSVFAIASPEPGRVTGTLMFPEGALLPCLRGDEQWSQDYVSESQLQSQAVYWACVPGLHSCPPRHGPERFGVVLQGVCVCPSICVCVYNKECLEHVFCSLTYEYTCVRV